MKKQLAATFIIVISPFLFVSCISTLLQEKAPTFSKEIQFTQPKDPFVRLSKSIYPAWKSKNTGSVISIISDCSENSASSSNLHQLITESIEQPQLIKQQQIQFQNKPAQFYQTQGELDQNPIEIQSLSFRRKKCSYISSISGRPNTLQTDLKTFNEFNESFKFE